MESDVAEVALGFLQVLGYAAIGLGLGAVLSVLISALMRALRRRDRVWEVFSRRLRFPQRVLFLVLGAGLSVVISTQTTVIGFEVSWRPLFIQIFTIVLILTAAWLLTSLMLAIEDSVLMKFEGAEHTSYARRVTTQMQLIRRIMVVVIWSAAAVGALMVFPAFRGIGTTFFASAGLASIVAGLALQSTLSNLFAGLQIAFTDSVRVGDVIVAAGETGNVEELTLTYVVMRIWDGRRVILPSTHFTSQPFENWTRREANLLGTVNMEFDWFTPVRALRIELQRIVEASELWDGHTCTLQVTDAIDGKITVRAVVSANSSANLWDLRAEVREQLVEWTQQHAPYSVPRTRIEPNTTTAPPESERQEFIDVVERQWAEERGEESPATEAPVMGVPVQQSPYEARRARKEAARADKLAAKDDPTILSGHARVLPRPSHAATEFLSAAELAAFEPETPAAQSRLYSGTADAEERARALEGPAAAEMDERERTAQRRMAGYQTDELPVTPAIDPSKPKDEEDA